MKILIIGATGNTGGTLVKIAMAEGHEVTAVVRSREKFEAQLKRCGQPQPNTLIADAKDFSAIRDACSGQDVVINTAGNVTDGEQFVQLFHGVVDAVEAGLGPGQRFWAFAGAAALDVPGSNTMTVSLPKVPAMFRAHAQNFDRLKSSSLSWSMLCPGPMITSRASGSAALRP